MDIIKVSITGIEFYKFWSTVKKCFIKIISTPQNNVVELKKKKKSTIVYYQNCGIYLKLSSQTQERRHWSCSSVVDINFEHISFIF